MQLYPSISERQLPGQHVGCSAFDKLNQPLPPWPHDTNALAMALKMHMNTIIYKTNLPWYTKQLTSIAMDALARPRSSIAHIKAPLVLPILSCKNNPAFN